VPYTKIDRTKEEIDPPSITFHMDGVDWEEVTKYFKENPDEFARGAEGTVGRTERRIPAQQEEIRKKRMEVINNAESILDLVKTGELGAIKFIKLTKEALDNGELPPYGVDLGFFFTPREGGSIQPIFQHSAQVADCDTTDVREQTAGEVEARRQVVLALKAAKKYLPGFENAYFTRLTSYMRTREGRHMIGDYQLISDDVAEARKHEDVIAKSGMGTFPGGPVHSARFPGNSMNISRERRGASPKDGGSYDIPYRSLVPKNVEGMLMAGKLISWSEDFKRDCLPDNMATGQAAGVAAAICAKKEITPRELEKDVSEVQKILEQQGAILHTQY
jgi:hypothetical protein